MRALSLATALLGGCTSVLGIGEPGAGGDDDAPPDAAAMIDAAPPADAPPQPDGTPQPPDLFAAEQFIPTGTGTSAVAIGDLDGDTMMDLVVLNSASGDVSYLRGQGGGSFAMKVDYPIGADAQGLLLIDLDHDTHLDVVVGNGGVAQTVTTRLQDPAMPGVLLAPTSLPVTGRVLAFAALDLTGGVEPELLTCGKNVLLLANNAGVLSVGDNLGLLNQNKCSVALGNIDGDFLPDFVVTAGIDGLMRIRQDAASPGTLLAPELGAITVGVPGAQVQSVLVTDFTGDGLDDLILSGQSVPIILVPQETATPGQFLPEVFIEPAEGCTALAAGLLGGGSRLDFACARPPGFTGYLDVAGQPTSWLPASGETASGAGGIAVGDVSGDGKPDVVLAGNGGVGIFLHQ